MQILDLLINQNEKDYFEENYKLSYCFPVVCKNTKVMTFREYIDEEHTVKGKFNIKEPSNDCPIVTPNLILVPLIAFDSSKNRIGYGFAYYDNTMRALKEKK